MLIAWACYYNAAVNIQVSKAGQMSGSRPTRDETRSGSPTTMALLFPPLVSFAFHAVFWAPEPCPTSSGTTTRRRPLPVTVSVNPWHVHESRASMDTVNSR